MRSWLSAGVGLLLACSLAVADAEGVNPVGQAPEAIARGREIYNTACTVCHGVDGESGDRAPALASARSYVRRTDAEIFDAIHSGVAGTGMPAVGLDEMDSWRVTAYIRSLRARAADFPVEGDVEAGAKLFWGAVECGRCHMAERRGGLLGPDLSTVAQRMPLRALREALTEAKPHAPLGYQPATIVTKSGERLTGVLKNRHNFSYQLLDESGRLHLLSSDEVASIEIRDVSLMPADFDQRLTPEEFQSLLAYLTRLKR